EEAFHRRKRPVWGSWRMDETPIKVKGHWDYLSRAGDKTGQPLDCLLTEQRDEEAALRLLQKAIRRHGVAEKLTIDGVRPMQRPSSATMPSTAPRSPSASSSISTTLWRRFRIIEVSSG